MNRYEFTYYGFIPIYNDFDQEWVIIEANSEFEARVKLKKRKIIASEIPTLVSINGKKIKTIESESLLKD